ncbi:disulfide bond formation protein B [Rhodopseudomonas palustris]|uniref:Disulfide bond formation protein DsbB n=1 Tax=Rhodopseudomonas palustris (strain DX-1) TaxID=652103 RepID=E6VLK2_RHOPX|nr:disulfide bond formation protein B [Rhodopseudomonas palustris]QDL99434.1 disulfide bond formation protein B [Rhodopseudomonas palustris]
MTADPINHRGIASEPGRPARIAGGVALTVVVVALVALAAGWFAQLVLEMAPCKLCLEQRYAYYLDIPIGLLVAFAAWRGAPVWLLASGLAVLGLMAFGNAGLAAYHAGVEWQFWAGPSDCSGPILDLSKAGGLLAQLDTVKVVRCDEVQWRFLGLSFAGYNVLMSLALAGLCGWGLARIRR